MSIVNIQRDGIFLDPVGSRLTFPTASGIGDNQCSVKTNGFVNTDFASAKTSYGTTFSLSANEIAAIGVIMNPPKGDRSPYRVKASSELDEGGSLILVGYAPVNITEELIAVECVLIPFDTEFDDLIIVEENTDTYADRALVFGICFYGKQSGITSQRFVSHLSVQRLGVSPPTMQFAVS